MKTLASQIDRIDSTSRLPKYRQVIHTILADIDQGILKPGDRIPSINETSEEYYLSRDTVEKAYRELSRRGVISSVPGKGFYVNEVSEVGRLKVMVIFNKLSDYKKVVYNSLVRALGEIAQTTFFVHNYNFKLFEHLILDQLGEYDHYVIMPHFYDQTQAALSIINQIPRNKLLILDRKLPQLDGTYGTVYQDFERDIVEGLRSGIHLLHKYDSMKLVFPQRDRYPLEILNGFRTFCETHGFPHEIVYDFDNHRLCPGSAYIVMDESALITLIKDCQGRGYELGKDIGLISCNDTPVKEILAGGITVITTDHVQMGETAARMILEKRRDTVHNPFFMIRRNSL